MSESEELPAAPAQVLELPHPPKAETDWPAEARKWEARAKENSRAAARLLEFEEAQKTEAQRLVERAEGAERDAAEARREVLRMRVIAETHLDPELHEFVRGDTEDEMRARAVKLASRDNMLASDHPAPRPDLSQGGKGGGGASGNPATDFADFIRGQTGR